VFDANATFANYHFRDFVDNDTDYSGNLLPGTARTTYYLSGDYRFAANYGIRAWHRFTGQMPVNDANSAFTDPYGITNIEFRYNREFQFFSF
jgi:iron complex outermembrane recepter protein